MFDAPKVLIIDDDLAVCSSIKLLLKRQDFEVDSISHPKVALKTIERFGPDLILLDMNFAIQTTGTEGLNALKEIRNVNTKTPIILMTGWATVQLAVEGMKNGANDFIAKPWDNKQLLSSINTLLDLNGPTRHSSSRNEIKEFDHIIGDSPAFLNVLNLAKRVAKTDASVLITGESGTGKELIAEAIHYESLRAKRPFVKVNLGGISSTLFESEMFGHKKGAFTDAVTDRVGRFEMADTGTIFLDEIGDLELSSQVKLLRVLQEQTFEVLGSSAPKRINVRVISATNKDLEKMVNDGTFREDLFYRINLIKVEIPPLRDRPDDIPLLVNYYVNNLKAIYNRPELKVEGFALHWLQQQEFHGNIRQLKNLVERVVLMSADDKITADEFKTQYRNSMKGGSVNLPQVGELTLEEVEILMIRKALQFHKNEITATANSLGLTRSSLYRRMEKYGIDHYE